MILLGYAHIAIHMADVDMDDDEVSGDQFGVRGLVVVNVEQLAVAAPVAAEVEDDAFVLAASPLNRGSDVGCGLCRFGVEVLVHHGVLGLRRDRTDQCEKHES